MHSFGYTERKSLDFARAGHPGILFRPLDTVCDWTSKWVRQENSALKPQLLALDLLPSQVTYAEARARFQWNAFCTRV